MAKIVLTRALRKFADGEGEFELDVGTIQALFRELSQRYPAMKRHLDEGVAVAIDGQIYQPYPWIQSVDRDYPWAEHPAKERRVEDWVPDEWRDLL